MPDSVKRTDVQDLTVEVRELRKSVRTGRNNQRVLAGVLGLSLLVTAGLGYVYVSDRDQKADINDLEVLVGAICPTLEVIVATPPRPDLTQEQTTQRERIIQPMVDYYQRLGC